MEELIPLFGIFFVIGVPVMSVAAKFVLQPLLRDVTEAIRGGKAEELEELRDRVARLEAHMGTQGRHLEQLVEAEQFRRRLEAGDSAPAASGAPPIPEGAATWSDDDD
jgi:hypothetical protein